VTTNKNDKKIFHQEKIRIGFHIKLKFHHAMLDPLYEIIKKEFSCVISSDSQEIIKFKPHFIIHAGYDTEKFRKNLPGTFLIYISHGFGTKNNWKGGIPKNDIVCLPNPWLKEQCEKLNIHPRLTAWLTGFIPTDKLFNTSGNNKKNLPKEFGNDPIILYAPTYNKLLNSVDVLGNDWLENLTTAFPNLNIIIKPHPAIAWFYPEWIKNWRNKAKQNLKVFIVEDCDEDIYEYLPLCDILLTDISSVMFYYLALNRPIILVTNSQRVKEKIYFDPDGAEWNWRDMGIEVHDCDSLLTAITRYLKEPNLHSDKRALYREKVYGSLEPGNATKNTAKKILDFLHSNPPMGKLWASAYTILSSNLNARAIEYEQTLKKRDSTIQQLRKKVDEQSKWALERDKEVKDRDSTI